MSLGRVREEAGVDVLQVGAAGADGGDAEGVAAVAPALVGSEVGVVKGLGVGAHGAAAAAAAPGRQAAGGALGQLPTARTSEGATSGLPESQRSVLGASGTSQYRELRAGLFISNPKAGSEMRI